jgi:carbon monoxide dehydrogenase subunit G
VIETEQSVAIDASIDSAWDYVKDIQRWANLMPGMRECTVVDADNSRWLLKVGVGGLVRTVKVLVHIDQWDGPERVHFSYQLEGDPVTGGGSYIAARTAAHATEVTLRVRVAGSGPMAPMWEAMCRPLLPQLAKAFAGKLKAEIEKTASAPPAQDALVTEAPSVFAATARSLRNFWQSISQRRTQD